MWKALSAHCTTQASNSTLTQEVLRAQLSEISKLQVNVHDCYTLGDGQDDDIRTLCVLHTHRIKTTNKNTLFKEAVTIQISMSIFFFNPNHKVSTTEDFSAMANYLHLPPSICSSSHKFCSLKRDSLTWHRPSEL